MRNRVLLFCLFLCSNYYAAGQEFPVKNYSVDDGLGHANVFRIFQDTKGFLWFSTSHGLSVFNGKTFKNYTSAQGLNSNKIMSCSQASDGTMLVCTLGGGLSFLNHDSFRSFIPVKEQRPFRHIMYSLINGKDTWLVAKDTIGFLLHIKMGRLINMTDEYAGIKNVSFTKMAHWGDTIFFASSHGIYTYNKNNGFKAWMHNMIQKPVYDIHFDMDGCVWVAVPGAILQIKNGRLINKTFYKGNSIAAFIVDKHHTIWTFAPGTGLQCITKGKLVNVTSQFKLDNVMINDLFEDQEGSIWIATDGMGVMQLKFPEMVNYSFDKHTVNMYAKMIIQHRHKVYVSSTGTLSFFDGHVLKEIPFKLLKPWDVIYFIQPVGNKMVIGTPFMVIEKSLSPPYDEKTIFEKGCISSCIDQKNRLWLGNFKNLFCKNEYVKNISTIAAFEGRRVNAIAEDNKGLLWIGTDAGLFKYNDTTAQMVNLGAGTLCNYINALHIDNHNTLWIATEGGLFHQDGHAITKYTHQNGLLDDKCNVVTSDQEGDILTGTLLGLNYIDHRDHKIYEMRTGLYPNEILSLLCDENKNLWVGTICGVCKINMDLKKINDVAPPVFITSASNMSINQSFPTQISVPYSDRKLHIEYIGLSYKFPESIEYEYSMGDEDSSWQQIKNNSIELSSLPIGHYYFKVRARKNKGKWSAPQILAVAVETPFWRTSVFIIICSLTLILLIYSASRKVFLWRHARKQKELEIENKIVYLKQQALGTLINPHFIFNCLSTIQMCVNRKQLREAETYLVQFSRLIRTTLEHARESFIRLKDEITRLELYLKLEQMRFGEGLKYSIEIDPSIDVMHTSIPNMMIQPYVENAIIHGIMPKEGGGKIRILFSLNESDDLQISVIDDGIGIHKVKKTDQTTTPRKHLGMELTLERLHLFSHQSGKKYSVTVSPYAEAYGTKVELIVPVV